MLPTGTMVLELMAEQCKSNEGVGAVIREGKLTQMCLEIYILRVFLSDPVKVRPWSAFVLHPPPPTHDT